MYSIGEYARIAQVSKRLLRYYDEIGLFQPIKIDSESGHRYYSATQLPELNRILALKDLGISLNQIQRFVSARKVLSQVESPDDFFWAVLNVLTQGDQGSKGKMTIIFHEDGIESDATPRPKGYRSAYRRKAQGNAHQDSDYIDMEFGKSLDCSSRLALANHNGITLTEKSLSSATMATFVPQTKDCSKLLGYNAIASWVEANHYDLAGPVRLVFLELPKQPGDDDYVMEIQFPVKKREVELNLQSLN